MTEWIVSSSALIAIVLLVRFLLREKLSLRVRYMLWLLVLVRLLVPVSFGESELSVLNALDTPAPAIGQSVPIPNGVQIFDPAGGFPSGTGIPTVTFPVGEAPTLSPEVNLDPNSVDPLALLWPLYLLGAVLTLAMFEDHKTSAVCGIIAGFFYCALGGAVYPIYILFSFIIDLIYETILFIFTVEFIVKLLMTKKLKLVKQREI